MIQLLNIFVEICLLRKGPQHLPAYVVLTALCLAAYLGSSLTYLAIVESSSGMIIGWALLSIVLMLVSVRLMVSIRGVGERYAQTISAFAGTGALLTLILIPVVISLSSTEPGQPRVMGLADLILLMVFIWSFVLDAHIYRNALSVSYTIGMLVTCVMFALSRAMYVGFAGAIA